MILLQLCFALLVSCQGGSKAKEEEKAENLPADVVEMRDDQVKLAGIETGTVEVRSLRGNLKVSGTVSVAPQSLATVCMPYGGFIRTTSLLPGDPVKRGQVLAVIENQEFVDLQQNYISARSRLEFTEADYKRHSELFKEDVYSQQNLQKVTSEYKSLQAEVRALEEKLAMIGINAAGLHEGDISRTVSVVSPISGFVRTVNVNIGKYVAPTDVLFEIVNSDQLFLELTLFEKDADKVITGQEIRFFINLEREAHEAVITRTGRSVSQDKTFRIYASVRGTCRNLMPGMYVNAIIEASSSQVTALPSEAIVSFDDKDYIFVPVREKTESGRQFTEYRMVEVTRGVTDGGYTEVRLPAGFSKESKVVVKGAYNLLSAKKNAGEMSC